VKRLRFTATALLAAASIAALPVPGAAQNAGGNGWFVPNQPKPAPQAPAPARRTGRRAAPLAAPMPGQMSEGESGLAAPEQEPPIPASSLPQPPVPPLPEIPKGSPPPQPVIGVLAVPDVMRQSSAGQIVEKVIGERRDKLRADAERAQQAWREMQQQLQNDAPKLTPEQGHARERALRDKILAEQKQLRQRARIIQAAAQVAAGQIERTLIAVIRQVAESRGMNLVLHRSQVALNVAALDITDAVTQQLNKVLPTVQIPPDGVDPSTLPKDWGSAAPAAAAQKAH
jgi:Skp family chaperone for outer membrane proteins